MTPWHLEDIGRPFAATARTVALCHGAAPALPSVRPLIRLGVGAVTRAAERLSTWRERARQRNALLELSDYMLCDIGVSRAAAIDEAEKAFWRS
jgi:uncharacterized protein YjiS (DUF1127 family)